MSTKIKAGSIIVWKCEWTESERGWGMRPDGISLHVDEAEMQRYIKDYWDGMPKETPHEYSRPEGRCEVIVSGKLAKELTKKKSIRLWHHEEKKYGTSIREMNTI